MIEHIKEQYSKPFGFACLLHVVLFIALFIDLDFRSRPQLSGENNHPAVKIVKAVAVQQDKVEEEMKRLTEEREEKEEVERKKQQKLAREAQRAVAARKEEQAKLRRFREQLKKAETARIAEQKAAEKQLQKIKQEQAAESKRLAKIKQQQAESEKKQKIADEAAKQAALEEKKKLAEEQKAAKQMKLSEERQQDLQNQIQEEENSAQMQSEIDKYKALVINAIQNNWTYPDNVSDDMTCLLQIKLGPGGVVLNVSVVKTSGNNLLDRSAEVAVYKASPLPVPNNPELFDKFRTLNLKVSPKGKVTG